MLAAQLHAILGTVLLKEFICIHLWKSERERGHLDEKLFLRKHWSLSFINLTIVCLPICPYHSLNTSLANELVPGRNEEKAGCRNMTPPNLKVFDILPISLLFFLYKYIFWTLSLGTWIRLKDKLAKRSTFGRWYPNTYFAPMEISIVSVWTCQLRSWILLYFKKIISDLTDVLMW